jgi:hypothetical protein
VFIFSRFLKYIQQWILYDFKSYYDKKNPINSINIGVNETKSFRIKIKFYQFKLKLENDFKKFVF